MWILGSEDECNELIHVLEKNKSSKNTTANSSRLTDESEEISDENNEDEDQNEDSNEEDESSENETIDENRSQTLAQKEIESNVLKKKKNISSKVSGQSEMK